MDNEMLALYKEANRKWNEKEHLMRNVLRYKDAPRASIGESDRRSLFAVGLTDDLINWKIVSAGFWQQLQLLRIHLQRRYSDWRTLSSGWRVDV